MYDMPIGIYKHPPQCGFQKGHGRFVSDETYKKLGQMASKRMIGKCERLNNTWIDGPTKHKGYWWIWSPNNPRSYNYKRMKRCDYVVEKYLNRQLKKSELLHHINHDRSDDSLENLYLCESNSEHRRIHWKEKRGAHTVSNLVSVRHLEKLRLSQ